MKVLRRTACMLIAAASFLSLPAHSASFSTDQSDLYYIPTESGWGMQLVQRGGTIFSTLFVYGPSTAPTWYVATMNPTGGAFQWSGDLYATTGPWFGTVPFNPANVTVTKVGTMTWIAQSTNTGNVSYTVNGVAVSKNVVRQTLVNENYSGHFAGAIHETDISCGGFNGTSDSAGILNVVQNGSAVTITASVPNGSCAYAGTLTQYGQMGDIVGSFSCSFGTSGTFHAFELQVTEFSLTGRFTANYSAPAGCLGNGWFGGLTVTTF